jgi:hypothetical protein
MAQGTGDVTPESPPVPRPSDRAPADRRWAGLDRRTVGPALFVLAFALLLKLALPALNAAVAYDDPVVAGDVMELSSGVLFTPVPGWNVESGVRLGHEPAAGAPATARLVGGDVVLQVTVGPFSRDSRALVSQIRRTASVHDRGDVHVTGAALPVATDAGMHGLLVHYSTATTEGVLGAFVVGGTGIQVEATGSGGLSDRAMRDIASMIASLRFEIGATS